MARGHLAPGLRLEGAVFTSLRWWFRLYSSREVEDGVPGPLFPLLLHVSALVFDLYRQFNMNTSCFLKKKRKESAPAQRKSRTIAMEKYHYDPFCPIIFGKPSIPSNNK